jgi:hypothetical protein
MLLLLLLLLKLRLLLLLRLRLLLKLKLLKTVEDYPPRCNVREHFVVCRVLCPVVGDDDDIISERTTSQKPVSNPIPPSAIQSHRIDEKASVTGTSTTDVRRLLWRHFP